MAFGFAALPTRKYAYKADEFLPGPRALDADGAKLPRARFPGHDAVVDQLHKAHRFQNRLVELERARRAALTAVLHDSFADLMALEAAAASAATEAAELRAAVKASNSGGRRKGADPALAARSRAARAAATAARGAYRARKRELYADPAAAAAITAAEEEAATAKAAAREEAVAGGLYWPTANMVMTRVKRAGPPPKFKRWDGSGTVSVQIQRKGDRKSPVEPVLDAQGRPRVRNGKPMTRRVAGGSLAAERVHVPNTLCWVERSAHPKRATVHLRIGSGPKRQPVWASFGAVVHRPIPAGTEVKWAHLVRRPVGTHYSWEVQFDVAAPAPVWAAVDAPRRAGRATEGTVGVALGWRLIDGAVRTAVWVGSDGRSGEVTIPVARVRSYLQVDHLQSVRDTLFDGNVAALRAFLAGRTDLPPEWVEATDRVGQWKSPNRLSRFVLWWRTHRLPGDDALFARLEGALVSAPGARDRYTGGRKQDRHLCDWQAGRRVRFARWRRALYAETAAALAREYARVAVANIDWHAIAENPEPDELDPEVNKRYRAAASCAKLRDELTGRMAAVAVAAPGVTVVCARCGAAMDPPGRGRWVTCAPCGTGPEDRAHNAARNILARAAAAGPVP